MKTKIKVIFLLIMLIGCTFLAPQKAKAQVSFQVFYDDLSPYGTWIDYPNYGYVWIPDAPNFTPYATNGYWAYTDAGWTWVSNYPWGWAPFHYGRWYIDAYYGPVWIPDYEWGPGWVTWRRSGNYYGWAPIGPGVSINYAYGNDYNLPYNYWTFVNNRDFGRPNINNYYIDNSNNVTIINNSTVINNPREDKNRNTKYNTGPERKEAEKYAGKTFAPVTIKDRDKPGQNMNKNELQMYRPNVQKNKSSGARPAPTKVSNLKDVKSNNQRNAAAPYQKTNNVNKQQPIPQKNNEQQIKQKPTIQQNNQKQNNQKPVQKQNNQPKQQQQQNKQQPIQQQNNEQQNIQKPVQPQNNNPKNNGYEGTQPRQNEPVNKVEEVKQQPQNNQPNKVENTNQPKQNNQPNKVQQTRPTKQNQQSRPPKK